MWLLSWQLNSLPFSHPTLPSALQTKEAQLMVAEMELSKVDNKTKLETTLQEEAAIRQDTKDREMERLADAAEKAARVMTIFMGFCCLGRGTPWTLNDCSI